MLRNKNKLMRAGRLKEAGSISLRTGSMIIKANSTYLIHVDSRVGVKALWNRVKKLTKKNCIGGTTVELTATDLNTFFAEFSTDLNYVSPVSKLPGNFIFDELTVFSMLDNLHPTPTGLD